MVSSLIASFNAINCCLFCLGLSGENYQVDDSSETKDAVKPAGRSGRLSAATPPRTHFLDLLKRGQNEAG